MKKQGGGTSVGAAKGAAYNTGWAGANLPDLKKVGYQVVRAAELRTAGECSPYLLIPIPVQDRPIPVQVCRTHPSYVHY